MAFRSVRSGFSPFELCDIFKAGICAALFLAIAVIPDPVSARVYEASDSIPFIPLAQNAGEQEITLTEEDFSEYFDVSGYDIGYYDNSLARNFSFMRYRYRGYDSRWNAASAMGIDMADISDGYTYWYLMQGLNSLENLNGTRLTAAAANRNYAYRLKYSGIYGIGRNGMSLSLAADRRWGRNGFVEGLFSDMTSVSGAVSRSSGRHKFNILFASAFGERGVRSAATQEVYDLAGDNLYNPNLGFRKGGKHTAKTRGDTQGLIGVDYGYKATDNLSFNIKAHSVLSESKYILPAWFDAQNPYPDYYRYLPSFFGNPLVSDPLLEAWRNGDSKVTRIDWAGMYETNLYNNSSDDGRQRAHYIMKGLVTRKFNNTVDVSVVYSVDDLRITGGLEVKADRSANYSEVDDLLGGDYWLDIDQYMLYDEYYGDMTENNMRDPGRKVGKSDRFGYYYRMNTLRYKAKLAVDYASGPWRLNGELWIGRTAYQREGKYEKQNFPGNLSYGKSAKAGFNENGLTGRVTLNLPVRSSVSLDVKFAESAPLAKDIFTAPEYRNHIIKKGKELMFSSVGLSYRYVSPLIAVEARGYYSTIMDGSDVINYFDDLEGEYVTLVMTDIDKVYAGGELIAEFNPAPKLSAAVMASYNLYEYFSDPEAEIGNYTSGKVILSGARSLLNGRKLAAGPQTIVSAQVRYRFPWWWTASLTANYAGNNYVSMNPARRMTRITDVSASRETLEEMLAQEKLDNAFTLNFTLGKEFRFRNRGGIGLWFAVENLLDNKAIRYTGYEQMRFHRTAMESGSLYSPFRSKYLYAYGRSYYLSLSYRF